MSFLAKALRTSLSVLVLIVFYAPRFGNAPGAYYSILISLVTTIVWFLLGNPFGIDNAYVALIVPLFIMSISQLVKYIRSDKSAGIIVASRPALDYGPVRGMSGHRDAPYDSKTN